MEYEVKLGAVITPPEGAEEVKGIDERIVAFKLPDGRTVKPWITWELQSTDESVCKDIDEGQLRDLGFEGFDYLDRELEPVAEKV